MIVASLAESYAVTELQSLAWSSGRERPVDRVSAAGRASIESRIGALIWKARDSLDSRAWKELEAGLYDIYRSRYGDIPFIAAAVVSEALHEFMVPHCRRCAGVREVIEGDLRAPCPDCHTGQESSGLHRYTDSERAMSMKISYGQTKRAAHKIAWVVNLCATEDRRMSLEQATQLLR